MEHIRQTSETLQVGSIQEQTLRENFVYAYEMAEDMLVVAHESDSKISPADLLGGDVVVGATAIFSLKALLEV